MGVVATHTMVTGTTSSGFVGYFASLSVGSMSPTTSDSIGSNPAINTVAYYFGFTTIIFSGHLDNSSITGMRLTPSGGSALTITLNNYAYDSSANTTRWSDAAGSTLANNTTYTVEFLGSSTNVNTEGTTLERRTPTKFSDFYGATRNVPPVSGAFKLSWLHDAEKYSHGATITAGTYTAAAPASFTIRGYHIAFCGSINTQTITDIINFYQGKLIYGVFDTYDQASSSYTLTLLIKTTSGTGSTPLGVNSQWYKLKVGTTAFYREDSTFSAQTISPYWTTFAWNTGSTQNIVSGNNYTVELIC
jgi:hypothetical protein